MLDVAVNGSTENAQDGLFTSAAIDRAQGDVIVKMVNTTSSARPVRVRLAGVAGPAIEGRVTVLASADLSTENGVDQPVRLAPVDRAVAGSADGIALTLDPQSFSVLRVKPAR